MKNLSLNFLKIQYIFCKVMDGILNLIEKTTFNRHLKFCNIRFQYEIIEFILSCVCL